jgi:2-polyprenyl-3-methyl-5-hydroxy-6-metoxy-1,4-benzoquinol methylase
MQKSKPAAGASKSVDPEAGGSSASFVRFVAASHSTRPVDLQRRLPFIYSAICRFAAAAGKPVDATDVLEVGCGRGDIALPMATMGCKVTAVDLDPMEIEILRERARVTGLTFTEIGCRDALDADSGQYDIVVASEIIEHTRAPERLLSRVVECMRPNAFLVLTTPNGYGPWELSRAPRRLVQRSKLLSSLGVRPIFVPTAHDHVQFFSRRRLGRLFSEAGLSVINEARSDGFLSVPGNHFGIRWLQQFDLRLVDAMPGWLVCGWYFLLSRDRQ